MENKKIKVITYGTFDLLHRGHVRLLERARALGDYLIVGITADDYDKTRGKFNVEQSLMERIEAVRSTGLADEIIIEEYEGQKIDDVKRYGIDIFTVGSDWTGKFDYIQEFCKVVYLDRTEGISSSEIRTQKNLLKIGLVGEISVLDKFYKECSFVNGICVTAVCSQRKSVVEKYARKNLLSTDDYSRFLNEVDAVYVVSHPNQHYAHVKEALSGGKHVICESPIAMKKEEIEELTALAKEKGLILFDAIKTAYATAFNRLCLLIKTGIIGEVISIDATCTSLIDEADIDGDTWSCICGWGPIALLPILQILGTDYIKKNRFSVYSQTIDGFDLFTKITLEYKNAIASAKVGNGVKSEGELVISGTKGYIYVPAPWWKTDYFEVRFENAQNNKRYFYTLDGEGIRYEILAFLKSIETAKNHSYIAESLSRAIVEIVSDKT